MAQGIFTKRAHNVTTIQNKKNTLCHSPQKQNDFNIPTGWGKVSTSKQFSDSSGMSQNSTQF